MNWKNLEDYPLKDLQKMWLDYFDKPYCSNSKAFFVSRIGYRLQELKYGGLKPETKNMLVKMFNSKEYRNPIFIKDERLPSVGTILVKSITVLSIACALKVRRKLNTTAKFIRP